jgi:hypothetical protein
MANDDHIAQGSGRGPVYISPISARLNLGMNRTCKAAVAALVFAVNYAASVQP